MKRLAVISAAIISLFALTSVTSAQYPPPDETVAIYASDSTPSTYSVVAIGYYAQSLNDGLGLFGGGAGCSVGIASQPGSDAFVFQLPAIFASAGLALVYTGSTPGELVVAVNCASGASGQVTLTVT